jgi:hypothetical protein
MDIIKEILGYWIKQILYCVILVLLVFTISFIISNTGNPNGRYVDYSLTNEL